MKANSKKKKNKSKLSKANQSQLQSRNVGIPVAGTSAQEVESTVASIKFAPPAWQRQCAGGDGGHLFATLQGGRLTMLTSLPGGGCRLNRQLRKSKNVRCVAFSPNVSVPLVATTMTSGITFLQPFSASTLDHKSSVVEHSSSAPVLRIAPPARNSKTCLDLAWNSVHDNFIAVAHRRLKAAGTLLVYDVSRGNKPTQYFASLSSKYNGGDDTLCVQWTSRSNPYCLVAAGGSRALRMYDTRSQTNDAVRTVASAHRSAITSLSISPHEPNYIASCCSRANIVKIWDIRNWSGASYSEPLCTLNIPPSKRTCSPSTTVHRSITVEWSPAHANTIATAPSDEAWVSFWDIGILAGTTNTEDGANGDRFGGGMGGGRSRGRGVVSHWAHRGATANRHSVAAMVDRAETPGRNLNKPNIRRWLNLGMEWCSRKSPSSAANALGHQPLGWATFAFVPPLQQLNERQSSAEIKAATTSPKSAVVASSSSATSMLLNQRLARRQQRRTASVDNDSHQSKHDSDRILAGVPLRCVVAELFEKHERSTLSTSPTAVESHTGHQSEQPIESLLSITSDEVASLDPAVASGDATDAAAAAAGTNSTLPGVSVGGGLRVRDHFLIDLFPIALKPRVTERGVSICTARPERADIVSETVGLPTSESKQHSVVEVGGMMRHRASLGYSVDAAINERICLRESFAHTLNQLRGQRTAHLADNTRGYRASSSFSHTQNTQACFLASLSYNRDGSVLRRCDRDQLIANAFAEVVESDGSPESSAVANGGRGTLHGFWVDDHAALAQLWSWLQRVEAEFSVNSKVLPGDRGSVRGALRPADVKQLDASKEKLTPATVALKQSNTFDVIRHDSSVANVEHVQQLTLSQKPRTEFLMCAFQDETRSRVLQLCGWAPLNVPNNVPTRGQSVNAVELSTIEGILESCEKDADFERAAALALFHGDTDLAIRVLARAAEDARFAPVFAADVSSSVNDASFEEAALYDLLAMTLAGCPFSFVKTGSASGDNATVFSVQQNNADAAHVETWRAQCRRIPQQLERFAAVVSQSVANDGDDADYDLLQFVASRAGVFNQSNGELASRGTILRYRRLRCQLRSYCYLRAICVFLADIGTVDVILPAAYRSTSKDAALQASPIKPPPAPPLPRSLVSGATGPKRPSRVLSALATIHLESSRSERTGMQAGEHGGNTASQADPELAVSAESNARVQEETSSGANGKNSLPLMSINMDHFAVNAGARRSATAGTATAAYEADSWDEQIMQTMDDRNNVAGLRSDASQRSPTAQNAERQVSHVVLASSVLAVLSVPRLPLLDRIAFAARYLPWEQFLMFVAMQERRCAAEGRVEGALLVGLGTEGIVGSLQGYVNRTSDVQSAALLTNRWTLLRERSSSVGDVQRAEASVALWTETYRNLLNQWKLWKLRCKLDVFRNKAKRCIAKLKATPDGETPHSPDMATKLPQTYQSSPAGSGVLHPRCLQCGVPFVLEQKSANGSFGSVRKVESMGAATAWLNKGKPIISVCFKCRKALPRCEVFFLHWFSPIIVPRRHNCKCCHM